jgi:serine/threonine protein kinase/Flp pilus assembly protein TadD
MSAALPADLLDALAGRFAVERELGRGGMATVLLAHDRSLDRRVAIKVLAPELSAALGPDRFAREIRLTARLVHPNIVPLFDSGEAHSCLYYVMPFIDGGTLRGRLLENGARPADEVTHLITDLAEALAYAHAMGIVHRDIKPENVFWQGGRALLADFGIATTTNTTLAGGPLTGTGAIIGTVAYMSPEQASGAKDIDGRSDLYSLGCVAFELLTGQPPFVGETPMAMLAAHLTAPVPSVRNAKPEVPPRIATVVERLLAKMPDERPPTAAALLEAMRTDPGLTPLDLPTKPRAPRPSTALASTSPEVRELVEKARTMYIRAMQGGEGARGKLEMARVYAEKALSKSPHDAIGLVVLSDVIAVLGIRGFTDFDAAQERAREIRMEALALDDTIGEVHTSIGTQFLYWEDDFETAGTELQRGAELSPDIAEARRLYGNWLKIAGRLPEALDEMRAAVEIDPRAPFMHVGLADVLMTIGRYHEAIGPLRDALRLFPRYEAALERLEMSCHRAGRHEEALDARRILLGTRGDPERMAQLSADAAADGWVVARERDLRRELAALQARAEAEDPFQDLQGSRQLADKIVIVLAELGEWTQAMDWIERGYYRRPGRLRRVLTDLPYDHHGLASDPRYARLLRTAGLEDLL